MLKRTSCRGSLSFVLLALALESVTNSEDQNFLPSVLICLPDLEVVCAPAYFALHDASRTHASHSPIMYGGSLLTLFIVAAGGARAKSRRPTICPGPRGSSAPVSSLDHPNAPRPALLRSQVQHRPSNDLTAISPRGGFRLCLRMGGRHRVGSWSASRQNRVRQCMQAAV